MEAIINKQQKPLLTLKDVEHLAVEPNATSMDILAAVASIARSVHLFPNNYHAPTIQQQQQQHTVCPKKHSLPPKESPMPLSNNHSIFDKVVFKSWTSNYHRPSTNYWRSEKGKRLQESSYSKEKEVDDDDDDDEDFYCTQRRQSVDSRKVVKRKKRDVYREDGEAQTKKKKKESSTCPRVPIDPEQYLPSDLKTLILETKRGKDLKLVVQKKLTWSDTRERLARFLIPTRQTVHEFLKDSEKEELKKKMSTEVNIIEPNNNLREWRIRLSRWEMESSPVFVLNGNWNNLVMENKLVKGMSMQLWAFRVDGELNFAMVNLSPSPDRTTITTPPVAPLLLVDGESNFARVVDVTENENNRSSTSCQPVLQITNDIRSID